MLYLLSEFAGDVEFPSYARMNHEADHSNTELRLQSRPNTTSVADGIAMRCFTELMTYFRVERDDALENMLRGR